MNLPKVSCYCATYGRTWALEEAVESFLRQDYPGEKEMIVLNDYTKHTLHFDHPEVKIFNAPARIMPLGAKFNATVTLCTGEILLPWEDDDIYLPNRLSYTIANMQNGFFHSNNGFVEKAPELLYMTGNYFHCNAAFARPLWDRAGGYITIDRCDLDINFLSRMKTAVQYATHIIPPDKIFYVYRWGSIQSYHASGWGSNEGVQASVGAANVVEEQAKAGKIVQGDYTLKPYWSYDYIAAAARAVKNPEENA